MNNRDLSFKIDTASVEQIYEHLAACNDNFMPPLDSKVELREYADKIRGKAFTFEAWSEEILVGLVASYLNDSQSGAGYISNVSVHQDFLGIKVASQLIKMCFKKALTKGMQCVDLEVASANIPAIRLYNKLGFVVTQTKDSSVIMRHLTLNVVE